MEDGVKCVEDLKYLKKKEWDDLFASESKVIRRRAAHVYGDYLKGDPDPKQCASELGLKKHSKESKEAKEKPVSISKPGTIKAAKDNTLLLDAGFSRKVTQTGEEKSTEREKKRKAAALEAEAVVVDDDSSVDVTDAAMGVEDDAEDEADDAATPRPALGPSDWRSGRCALSQNLVDPADDNEKSTWDNDLLPLCMQPNKNCHDLEDVDHHYKIIKCSKTSSDSEVNERFKEKWNANKAEVLRYHPDKVTADRGKYAAAKSLRDKLQAAKEVLCKKDEHGCYANRVE